MFTINKISDHHVTDYAAEELKKYLRMMMPYEGEIEIKNDPKATTGFRLGLMSDFGLPTDEAKDLRLDDIIHIDTDTEGGIIAGSNYRSILLAVYFYLRKNGCRWLYPGVDGEFIPVADIQPVKYHKLADMRYRGQCNEGAESQQAMIETIEFAPKIGMNCYMMEFDIPFTYYNSYYSHVGNSVSRKPEPVDARTVLQWKRVCEVEIAKRGLLFHDMGHGWTAEAFGISSLKGWTPDPNAKIPEESKDFVAMIKGKRELLNGVALNTNFCMSNPIARKKVTGEVVKYAKKSSNVDVLHVWLADWQMNHCECEECQKMIPSDWYVVLLNEIDEALTKENLDTKIGAIIYSDTAWEPEQIRIKNPSRFSFFLGAISRSYLYSVPRDPKVEKFTPYVRNVSGRLDTMEEYIARARRWMEMTNSDFVAYEYHFWKEQCYAPGVFSYVRRLKEDIMSYHNNDFIGIIEDGSQRSFFPNGLAFYAYSLFQFDFDLTPEEVINEYLEAAYGDAKEIVRKFFEGLDSSLRFDFLEQVHSKPLRLDHYRDKNELPKLQNVSKVCDEFEAAIADYQNMPYRVQTVSVRLLNYYVEYCRKLADLFILKCNEKDAEAFEEWKQFKTDFGKYEVAIERYYDQSIFSKTWDYILKPKATTNQ